MNRKMLWLIVIVAILTSIASVAVWSHQRSKGYSAVNVGGPTN